MYGEPGHGVLKKLFAAIFFADKNGFEHLHQHIPNFLHGCHNAKIQTSTPGWRRSGYRKLKQHGVLKKF